jgi:hypothetical protein
MRITLGDLFGAGTRALTRYTGTLLAVFVVQTLVSLACMVAVAAVLAQAFAHLPLWDDAVDGDLVALIECLRYAKTAVFASGGIVFAAIALWQLVSWFVVGGLYGVLAQRPEGRGDTARCFGASGATTYLTYLRLALCSIPGGLAVLFVLFTTSGLAQPRLEHALTYSDLIAPAALALLPAALLLHVVWTIADYARVELTLRHDTHDPGVLATYLRTAAFVIRRPITLVHGALGWLAFGAISLGYACVAHGHPMYGAEGAVTLFVIRQGVALARTAIRFGILAGQLELGRTRAAPPRRIEANLDSGHA